VPRFPGLFTVLLGLAALGCSSTPAQNVGLPGGVPCPGPLALVGASCPLAFDGTLASAACPSYVAQRLFKCAEATLILESGGSAAAWCVYDPSSHVLVGASVTSQYPQFCGGVTYAEVAGTQVEPACALGVPLESRLCPADGLDGSPSDGASDGGDGAGEAAEAGEAMPDGGAPDAADGDAVSE